MIDDWETFEIPEPEGGAVQKTVHPNPEVKGRRVNIYHTPEHIMPEHLEQRFEKRRKALREDQEKIIEQQFENYRRADQRTEKEKKYDQLLYAVQQKFPGETRHETALRYIREAETGGGQAKENVVEREDQEKQLKP